MRSISALAMLIGLSLAASGCDRQSAQNAQGAGNAAAVGNALSPDEVSPDEAAPGSAGKTFSHVIDRSHKGEAMPDKPFTTIEGKPTTLKAIAQGKPMLVNLWATWCAPCVAELPALDRAAKAAEGKGVKVIAVSQDMEPDGVPAFWSARKLSTLQTWLDRENALGFHYGTGTLPTTILYDGAGKEVARIVGALEWDEEDGQKLIAEIGG